MTPSRLTLHKEHKLCSHNAVEALFSRASDVKSAVAYPLRAVWRHNTTRTDGAPMQFLITVPKRHFKHAVDRVRMRRLIREAYRLNRLGILPAETSKPIDIAFLYISSTKADFTTVQRAVIKLLHNICNDETCQ